MQYGEERSSAPHLEFMLHEERFLRRASGNGRAAVRYYRVIRSGIRSHRSFDSLIRGNAGVQSAWFRIAAKDFRPGRAGVPRSAPFAHRYFSALGRWAVRWRGFWPSPGPQGLELTHVFNRGVARKRVDWVPSSVAWSEDADAVLASDVDVVVELAGGLDPAGALGAQGARGRQERGHGQQEADLPIMAWSWSGWPRPAAGT